MSTVTLFDEERCSFTSDQSCQNYFEIIKRYWLNSPILGAPTPAKMLMLYIASQEQSVVSILAQENEDKKEQAMYYLSRTFIGVDFNYAPIEKMCLELLYVIKKIEALF